LYESTLPNIIDPDDVDTDEENIHGIEPRTSTRSIRHASYANIIHTDLRSSLVHTYELGENLTGSGWHQGSDCLNYVNYDVEPEQCKVEATAKEVGVTSVEAREGLTKVRRCLYFPYAFIRRLTQETADSVFSSWDTVGIFSRPQPANWWIDG
jgi:hypothetical protein